MKLSLVAASICSFLVSAEAQAAAPSSTPPSAILKPASPRSVPGDWLPPSSMLDDNGKLDLSIVPAPPRPDGGAPPPYDAAGPSPELALRLASAALADCTARGLFSGVAVIDSLGRGRAMLEGAGSDGHHMFLGMRRALTALAYEMPTSQVVAGIQAGRLSTDKLTPYMSVVAGAVPIRRGGKLIGAIGAAGRGGVGELEQCVSAGLRASAAELN